MRTAGPGPATVAVLTAVLLAVPAACTLTTSLEGYAGLPEEAGAREASTVADTAPAPDAAVAFASCDALKRTSPQTPDGPQWIDPDGDGPLTPFPAYCDMTTDDGGWMLVSSALLADETKVGATVVRSTGDHDGAVLKVFVNSEGCASTSPPTRHRILLADRVPWERVRVTQTFKGSAACWYVFGGQNDNRALDPNLVPFDATKDVLRDGVGMGGRAGGGFDGITDRCDDNAHNFWLDDGPTRRATVILRRRGSTVLAGLSTGADCGGFGPGEASPTWWEYRDIYVK